MRWLSTTGQVACLFSASVLLACVIYVDESAPCDGVICGQEAYCDAGLCYCNDGLDGDPYDACAPAEPTLVQQDLLITDVCDDGVDINWKVYSEDLSWVWPGPESSFRTDGFQVDTYETIQCYEGEWVCWGASDGLRAWGADIDGADASTCVDCCFQCYPDVWDIGLLRCDL
ncbi:MAG: hypothetical protein R3A51_07715 [Nannocystaceae bacterium]|nr:hypothetical protein [Myxococcales bacterium]